MNYLDIYEKFNDKEKLMFSNVCNQLLNNCFLCKDKKENREAFYFVLNYKMLFDEFFKMINWELTYNHEIGAMQLTNPQNKNLLKLKKSESIVLLILRILYQEQITSFTQSNNVMIKVDDIHQKYENLEFKKKIYKTDLLAILRLFKKFNLVDPLGDVTKGNCQVIIYPTILLAVSGINVDVLYNVLKSYELNGGDEVEEAD